ncbi:MAG: hypothetical protein Fur005_11920 [Roseiflexaceae bacterium]|jgi:hypothetical protein
MRNVRGPKTTRYKNITRIDHPAKRTFGYNVRVAWKGKRYGKFFSDRVYGDRLGALAAAIDWRDKTEREIGKPRTEHQVIGWNSRNKSGALGIRRSTRDGRDTYEVVWVEHGEDKSRRRATRFSITKHGERKAFKLALRARQRGERMRWKSPKVRRQETPPPPAYQPWLPPV